MNDTLAELRGGVLHVCLDRPEQRNAMTGKMVEELLDLLGSDQGLNAGAILLSGNGRGFCAGSDLRGLAGMSPQARSMFEADCGRLARAMTAHPRPIVAAVHGFAIGGGLTLAAACDIVVTAADAKWSLPEVPIGLFPAWGLEAVTQRTGITFARRLSFGIDTFDGSDAVAAGLADLVADDPQDRAADFARRLAELPAMQASAAKDYFAFARHGEEADRHANHLFTDACETVEGQASLARFSR